MDPETKAALAELDRKLHVLSISAERIQAVQRAHGIQLQRAYARLLPDLASSLEAEVREMIQETEDRRAAETLAKYQNSKPDA